MENDQSQQPIQADGPMDFDEICEKHNIPLVGYKIGDFEFKICRLCDEERRVEYAENEKREEEAERQRKIRKNFSECQIGDRFIGLNFKSYVPENDKAKDVLEKCIQYAKSFEKAPKKGASLIFLGKPGTGKNHLASAICTHIMENQKTTLHTTVMKMIRRIKSTWSRGSSESEQKAIIAFCEPDLLVIDEVGVQFGSETEKLILTEIINERYERYRSTILISNLNLKNLADTLGERVIDRFRDGGDVLVFDWESYRKKPRG